MDETAYVDVWYRSLWLAPHPHHTSHNEGDPNPQLSTPTLSDDSKLVDPVTELVVRHHGSSPDAEVKRLSEHADNFTQDMEGVRVLMGKRSWHAAVVLTGRLLKMHQDSPSLKHTHGNPCTETPWHTPYTLQLWLCRAIALCKLRQNQEALHELESFGTEQLDGADLYFEYYPKTYGNKKGSMVPFSLRVLHAELPFLLGDTQLALDRLQSLLHTCQTIIEQIESQKLDQWLDVVPSKEDLQEALTLWREREVRVLYCIGNRLAALKDYLGAMTVYNRILARQPRNAALLWGMGRMQLQLGDVRAAEELFTRAEQLLGSPAEKSPDALINRGLAAVQSGRFEKALDLFRSAADVSSSAPPSVVRRRTLSGEGEPKDGSSGSSRRSSYAEAVTSPAVAKRSGRTEAVNNLAICSQYLGRLGEALKILEHLLQADTTWNVDDNLIFNLCTLYELESQKSTEKKEALIKIIAQHASDDFDPENLKLQPSVR
eukprot:Colp12_sorted_trinity150504_noHs@20375